MLCPPNSPRSEAQEAAEMEWKCLCMIANVIDNAKKETMTNDTIKFCGWTGPQSTYGLFRIDRPNDTDNPDPYTGILIVHEGNWAGPLGNKFSWPECEHYEQAQQIFGDSLELVGKNYDMTNRCTYFRFKLPENRQSTKIVVPATGEGLNFKIYGIRKSGHKELLIDREL